jgi:hypothetical protein
VRGRGASSTVTTMLRGMQWSGWRAVLAMSTALVLAGCAQTASPPPVRSSAALPTPAAQRFVSTTAAGASAKSTYETYLTASQHVSEAGGTGVQMLRPLVSDGEYSTEVAGAKALESKGLKTKGATRLLKFELQSADLRTGSLRAYACVDLSAVHVFDADGTEVTPASRPRRQTSVVGFEWSRDHLVVSKNGTWSGPSIC